MADQSYSEAVERGAEAIQRRWPGLTYPADMPELAREIARAVLFESTTGANEDELPGPVEIAGAIHRTIRGSYSDDDLVVLGEALSRRRKDA